MAGKYRNLYYSLNKYIFRLLPDTLYHNLLGWIMHRRFGVGYHWMNITHPKTFSEKLQWLKKNGPIERRANYPISTMSENGLVELLVINI